MFFHVFIENVLLVCCRYTEQVIHALVEIIHAFQASENYSNITIGLYIKLLLCHDPIIAFSAKQALCKVVNVLLKAFNKKYYLYYFLKVLKPRVKRRKVFIPSPPHCDSPAQSKTSILPLTSGEGRSQPTQQVAPIPAAAGFDVDMVEAINFLEQHGVEGSVNHLEAMLGMCGLIDF